MKKILLPILITLCFFDHGFAQTQLTNRSVIALSDAGLSSTLIINKIQTSSCSFALSTDDLIALKQAKVSDDVIAAMMNKQPAQVSSGNPLADSIINKLPQSGIYYYDPTSGYTKLAPSIVTGTKTSMGLGGAFTGTVKSKSELDGSEANVQVRKQPVFYFYFGNNTQESKLSNTGSQTVPYKNELVELLATYKSGTSNVAFSPNDFKLVKLDKSRKSRSFQTGKMSAFGGISNGVSKNVELFKYEEITPNLYRVYFPAGLEDGEYCFLYASSISQGGVTTAMTGNMVPSMRNDVKVFDFGVK